MAWRFAMDDSTRKPSEAPDKVRISVDVGTVTTVTSSANSFIDNITTTISQQIGSEIEANNPSKNKP